ncbi:hypothetical protein L0E83_14055 [Marichromatium gracile]|uniref:hypothetical protein n=1 Tax=Marichromatium gracile TaxID=1048 RepID=UPI001F36EDD3|nr:hypothetical protein [Marichromatium gracile]MCF1184553.1 hypothetical protein [Marichromatium gracile]
MRVHTLLLAVVTGLWALPATADWTDARCEIYPKGEDRAEQTLPCTFSQRQGYVTITREDGVVHELAPSGEAVGNFRDQAGRPVYRQSGLGDQGLIFRFPDESLYIYWDRGPTTTAAADNPTWPFSTADYDATTLLRCRALTAEAFGQCPAGILRMDDGQASIVVQSPAGEQFTINFMTGYVNATNRSVEASRDGDTWTVVIDGQEVYEVPLAAIEGG